jgi:hypothetical protein
MKKLQQLFAFIIFVTVTSCNKTEPKLLTDNYDIVFVKGESTRISDVCNVLLKKPNGETQKIESFDYDSNYDSDTLLCTNISATNSFRYIDSLPLPNGFGIIRKKYSAFQNHFKKLDGSSGDLSYFRYFLSEKDSTISVIRELWDDNGWGKREIKTPAIETFKMNLSFVHQTESLASENSTTETNKPNDKESFQGQELKDGEKIIKITWGMENKSKLNQDVGDNEFRFASKPCVVPNGKKWILLYINEDFTYDKGQVVGSIPFLFFDNKQDKIYNRRFSNANNIQLAKAKDENFKYYSGSTIKAVSSRHTGKGAVSDFINYTGEMWFLEVNN